jgi:uncharacterized damage-inducible protein DinB
MDVKTIQQLYDYNYWAHARVWDCVVKLSEEQLMRPLDYSIGSIHAQLVHTMSAESVWFDRIRGDSPPGMFDPSDFPTRHAIRTAWDAIEQRVRHFLQSLDSDTLSGDIIYQRTNGEPKTTPLLGILLHLVNHGTDHRAQTLAMIDRVGGETVAQDLIFYLRQQWV